MLALVGSTDTRHTLSHSDTHMAKMVRKPMKVATSARPLMVSMKPLSKPHRTETKKAEADQAEGSGFGDGSNIRCDPDGDASQPWSATVYARRPQVAGR